MDDRQSTDARPANGSAAGATSFSGASSTPGADASGSPKDVSGSPKNVAVLGSTGSIGRSALEVIAGSDGRLRPVLLSGHCQIERLVEQAKEHQPRWIVTTNTSAPAERALRNLPRGVEPLEGHQALAEKVASPEVDVVLAAIVGSAGLRSTWAALEAGKTVALANKETLVMAGPLVQPLIKKTGATLLPVDSEHSAIYQAMECGRREEVRRVVLTGSGGPFRTWPPEHLTQVTVDDALAHPTWDMGPKNTIDSATMMNKALEIIEAKWLFGLSADQIEVVLHPQSIVHSMVEFVDGSVIAQLSPPDMKMPIQYALEHPRRRPGVAQSMDWTTAMQLDFEPACHDRFPALGLGFEVVKAGGSSGAVLNAANEAAVAAFIDGDLHFTEIVPACQSVLESHHFEAQPSLDDLLRLDRWARKEINSWVCA